MKALLVRTASEWRNWLEKHHAAESGVWLIFHKQPAYVVSIDRTDALDEALCYGWVDSLVKRMDDRRYLIKFTPRREDSRWSEVNRKRYAELKKNGRLKPAGVARAPTERGYDPRPVRPPLPAKLPAYIQTALKKHPAALRHFEALSLTQRRRYLHWIDSAKRDETKQRHLEESIRLLTAGKELGLK